MSLVFLWCFIGAEGQARQVKRSGGCCVIVGSIVPVRALKILDSFFPWTSTFFAHRAQGVWCLKMRIFILLHFFPLFTFLLEHPSAMTY